RIARILRYMGSVAARLGHADAAAAALEESIELLQALGESHLLGHVLDHLGEVEQIRGELDRALHMHRRGRALLEAAGCMEGVNTSQYWQGLIAQRRGDSSEAVALALRSLRGYRLQSNRRDLPSGL